MIWSDEGDSVPFLKRQLQLLSELILFKYGPHVNVRASSPADRRNGSFFITVWASGASHAVQAAGDAALAHLDDDAPGQLTAELPRPIHRTPRGQRRHSPALVRLSQGSFSMCAHRSRTASVLWRRPRCSIVEATLFTFFSLLEHVSLRSTRDHQSHLTSRRPTSL